MIISINDLATHENFEKLLGRTKGFLENDVKLNGVDYFKEISSSDFEKNVARRMEDSSIGTEFEGSIELVSGQKFPDIVAKKYFGVEVKKSKNNDWTSIGNSINETTRVECVEKIYVFFGKLIEPVQFRYRKYDECVSGVLVTHYPRYALNMDIPSQETFFSKIGITYDELRKRDDTVKTVVDYYRSQLAEGEELWWIQQSHQDDSELGAAPLGLRFYNSLTDIERQIILRKGMVLFPEILSTIKSHDHKKYKRIAMWMVTKESIVNPSLRDIFSSGGRSRVGSLKKLYGGLPAAVSRLVEDYDEVVATLRTIPSTLLSYYWGEDTSNWTFEQRYRYWHQQLENYVQEETARLCIDSLRCFYENERS